MTTETTSAPGNPGATVSLKNDGPAFELPAELREPAAEAATTPEKDAKPSQTTAQDPAENPEAAKTDDTTDKKEEKPRNRAQERIDDLTRRMREAERRAADLTAETQRLNARLQERAAKVDPNDFAQTEDYRVEKAVKTSQIEATFDQAQMQAVEAQRARVEVFQAKVEAARERDPSIEQKLQRFASVPVTEFGASFIADSAAAVEIAAHLADFPAEAARIAKLPVGAQGVELARLEAKLTAPPVRRISQAPTPVPTLGGSRSPAVKDTADMSVSELSAMLYGKRSA